MYLTKKFNVGETVVIARPHSIGSSWPYLFATVTEVGKMKIKTDKGDFSANHGGEWGSDRWSNVRHIVDDITVDEAQERNVEIEAEHAHRKLAQELDNIRWRDLDTDTLKQVAAIVAASRAAQSDRADARKG